MRRHHIAATALTALIATVALTFTPAAAQTNGTFDLSFINEPAVGEPLQARATIALDDDLNGALTDISPNGSLGCTLPVPLTDGEAATTCLLSTLQQTTDLTGTVTATVTLNDGTTRTIDTDLLTEPLDLDNDATLSIETRPAATPGGPAALIIEVDNPSRFDLDVVEVTSNQCGLNNDLGPLRAGGNTTTRCTVITADHSSANVQADITFETPGGPNNTTIVETVDLNVVSADLSASPGTSDLQPGGNATVNIALTNDGDVPLGPSSPIELGGLAAPGCTLPSTAPGDTVTTTCTWTDLPQTLNTAGTLRTSVIAQDANRPFTLTASTGLGPLNLDPSIDGTLSMPNLPSGTQGTAEVDVQVGGNVTFDTITINVEACSSALQASARAPGSQDTVSCDYTADIGQSNTAVITGTYRTAGGVRTYNQPVLTTGGNSARVTVDLRNEPANADMNLGVATLLFDISKTGSAEAVNVTATTGLDSCQEQWDALEGGTHTLTCDITPDNPRDFTLTVTGQVEDIEFEASTSTTVEWYGPTIAISLDRWDRDHDDAIPMDVIVTNKGDLPLNDVALRSEPALATCLADLGALPVGATHQQDCTFEPATFTAHDQVDLSVHGLHEGRRVAHDLPFALDLNGDLAGNLIADRTPSDITINAFLTDPRVLDHDDVAQRCHTTSIGSCLSHQASTESDDGRWELSSLPPGTYTVTLAAPRAWVFTDTGESTITIGDVQVRPGRSHFDPDQLDLAMEPNPNLVARIPDWAYTAGLAGLFLLAAIGGVWQYRRPDPFDPADHA